MEKDGGLDDDRSCYTIRCLSAIEYMALKTARKRNEALVGHFYINVAVGRCAQVEVEGPGGKIRRWMACQLPPGILEFLWAFRSLVFAMLHAIGRHYNSRPPGPLCLDDRRSLPGAAAFVEDGVTEASTIHPSKVLDLADRFHSPSFTTAVVAHMVSSVASILATDKQLGKIVKLMHEGPWRTSGDLPAIQGETVAGSHCLHRIAQAGPERAASLDKCATPPLDDEKLRTC